MIEFRTLGTLVLKDRKELSAVLAQPKRVALLAYLTLARPRGFQLRDKLVGLFWPETDAAHARNALSQALHFLRRGLGNDVLATRGAEEIGIEPDQIQCDALTFEAALDAGQVEYALGLYGGDLLPGMFLSDCPEFERWLEDERARLRERAVQAAVALAESHGGAQIEADAARWLRQAASWAPYDESILRRLVRILDEHGERASALLEYEAFAQRLAEDLEVEPSSETRALIDEVRRVENRTRHAPTVTEAEYLEVAKPRRSRRISREAAGAIAALGVLAVVGATVLGNRRADEPALDPKRVLVDKFRNETGDSALDPLGRIAADWIAQGLARTRAVNVVSSTDAVLSRQVLEQEAVSNEMMTGEFMAEEMRAGTLVSGGYSVQHDSVLFYAIVTDVAERELLRAVEPIAASLADPMPAIGALRERMMGLIASRFDPRPAPHVTTMATPPLYEAYLEFVEGLEALRHGGRAEFLEQVEHFYRAATLDTTFATPLLTATRSLINLMRWSELDSIARILQQPRYSLSPSERYLLEGIHAHLRGDWADAYAAYQQVAELTADEWAISLVAFAAMRLGRYASAVEALGELNPNRGITVVSPWLYWKNLTACLHFLGQHREELRQARRARELFPNEARYVNPVGHALAALGRVTELHEALNTYAKLQTDPLVTYRFMSNMGNDLQLHGHEEAARELLNRSVAWFAARPTSETSSRRYRLAYANALNNARRWEEARPLVQSLVDASPQNVSLLAWLGVLKARTGNREDAITISEQLRDWNGDIPRQGSTTMYRARIAAVVGQREASVQLLKQALAQGYGHELLHLNSQAFESLRDYEPYRAVVSPIR